MVYLDSISRLRTLLLNWYKRSARELPWRSTRDPWHILLSEVMLQQTRVETVIPYYERFVKRFPTAASMAACGEQEVLALWAGLGYYSRARNLHRAARQITERGEFPATYGEIRELPGVGAYTAAAVASIAFNLPHASVDGNVLRVLSRLTCEWGDIKSGVTRRRLAEKAGELLDPRRPGDFNQALMELGATLCSPRDPQCVRCPWRSSCAAFAQNVQRQLPVKQAGRAPVRIHLRLLLIEKGGRVLMRPRSESDRRLAGFWELPEAAELPEARVIASAGEFRHSITHHNYSVEVTRASVSRKPRGYRWVSWGEMFTIPVSTMSRKAFRIAGITVPINRTE